MWKTGCGQCGVEVQLRVEDEQIVSAQPHGLAAFQADWDGQEPLADALGRSPLFCSDSCLDAWQTEHASVPGFPFAADTFLFIGMGMANALGSARFELVRGGH